MGTKARRNRLESDVDSCRSEGNWKRLRELIPAIRAKSNGFDAAIADLIDGEVILESFIEKNREALEPKRENQEELAKAESSLHSSLGSDEVDRSMITLEANLLLSKLHYYCAKYREALKDIERSKLDSAATPFVTIRSLRLVAEAYAIKGFCLEAAIRGNLSTVSDSQLRALFCFEKSAELAICYIQELEKSLISNPRSSSFNCPSETTGQQLDKMGELLEYTLEHVPMLHLRRNLCGDQLSPECVQWYRKIITSLGDKMIGEKLQQRLSRQLAELLIHGMPEYSLSDSYQATAKFHGTRLYSGSSRSFFAPSSRLEEIILLLFVSEFLAEKVVVLNQTGDATSNRSQSLQSAKSVQNLLTLVLSSLRQYEILANVYERSMKFANDDQFIWFQFALTLLCYGRSVRASRIMRRCVKMRRVSEGSNLLPQLMIAALIEIEHVGQFDEAIQYAKEAVALAENTSLLGRCNLLLAIALSLKAETLVHFNDRQEIYRNALCVFQKVVAQDPYDDVAHYYCALQYAIGRNLDSAIEHCERSLELNPENVNAIMLLALIFSAKNNLKNALELIIGAIDEFPSCYALHVLRIKLDAKCGRVDDALQTAAEMFYFWKNPEITDTISVVSQTAGNGVRNSHLSAAHLPHMMDTIFPFTPLVAAPVGIVPPTTLPSSAAITCSIVDLNEGTAATTANNSDYGNSSTSDSRISTKSIHTKFKLQANIWVELLELFIDSERIEEVQSCVVEACATFANSHQAIFLKGRLSAARYTRCNDKRLCERLRTEAKTFFLGALAIFPSHIPSLRHLANIYNSEGNNRMAEKLLRDIINIEPLNRDVWYSLGVVLAECKQHMEAMKCFDTAATLDSTPIVPFTSLPIVVRYN